MVRTTTTISIDSEVKKTSMEILKQNGIKFSNYIERCLRKLIENNEKEEKE